MQKPTKKSMYILIACILFLIIIFVAKSQTTKMSGLLNLETSSSTDSENINTEDWNFITGQTNDTAQASSSISGGETMTENFSRSLFAKYISTNEGAELTAEDSQALINEAVNSYATVGLGNTSHFTYQDLIIVKSTEANLRYFANTFVTKEDVCMNDIKRVAESTEDPAKTGAQHIKCANDFVKIPITQEISERYLNLINAFYSSGQKIASLEGAKDDPLKALVIIKEIGTLDQEKVVSYQSISSLIKKSGIIFSNTEPGKAWLGSAQ